MNELELYHYGVKGMKWGVRKAAAKVYSMNAKVYKKSNKALASANEQAAKRQETIAKNIKSGKTTTTKSSKTTNKVLDDYANMTNREFKTKYRASKRTYAKRVKKYGDPFIHATTGKKLVGAAYEKNKSRLVTEVKKNSTSYQNGKFVVDEFMKTNKGRTFNYAMLTINESGSKDRWLMDDIEYAHRVASGKD